MEPESVIQAGGLEGVFECLVPGTSHVWIVNGVRNINDEFPPEIKITGGSSGNPSVLTIPGSLQFNNSVVHCVALSLSGAVFSRNTTLIFGEYHKDAVSL